MEITPNGKESELGKLTDEELENAISEVEYILRDQIEEKKLPAHVLDGVNKLRTGKVSN
jgi:hypothetical protein